MNARDRAAMTQLFLIVDLPERIRTGAWLPPNEPGRAARVTVSGVYESLGQLDLPTDQYVILLRLSGR